MTDADTVRGLLNAICIDSLETPLDKLLANRSYNETQEVSAMFIRLTDVLDRLVAERDANQWAHDQVAPYVDRAEAAEAERDRLRAALTALVEHIDLNGGCHRGCPEHDMAREALGGHQ